MSEQSPNPPSGYFRTPTSGALLCGALGGGLDLLNLTIVKRPGFQALVIFVSVFVWCMVPGITLRSPEALRKSVGMYCGVLAAFIPLFAIALFAANAFPLLAEVWLYVGVWQVCVGFIAFCMSVIFHTNVGNKCVIISQISGVFRIPFLFILFQRTASPGHAFSVLHNETAAFCLMTNWFATILAITIPAVIIERSLRSASAPPAVPTASDANNATR